jgi:hypothetical protein
MVLLELDAVLGQPLAPGVELAIADSPRCQTRERKRHEVFTTRSDAGVSWFDSVSRTVVDASRR